MPRAGALAFSYPEHVAAVTRADAAERSSECFFLSGLHPRLFQSSVHRIRRSASFRSKIDLIGAIAIPDFILGRWLRLEKASFIAVRQVSERASNEVAEEEEGGEDEQWIIGFKSGHRRLHLREETGFGISGDVVNVIGILLGRVAE